MKKRIVTALVAVALLVSQTAVFAQHNFDEYKERTEKIELFEQADENVELFETYGDFEYSINDDDTVTITDYNGSSTELIIPSEIDGKTVTTIGYCAFWGCSSLTSVTIPNSVTTIGINAFSDCSSLQSITIPYSVTTIDSGAFAYCKSITSFKVSESNVNYTSQDGVLFNKDMTELMCYPAGSTMTEYTIPNSVTKIGNIAFYSCSSLTNVTIPGSVTEIGSYAFISCNSLTNITIPYSVTTIDSGAFAYCKSITSFKVSESNVNYTSQDGVLFNKAMTKLMYYPASSNMTEYTIPNSVTTIGNSAFYSCNSLTNVTIPNSVTTIGNSAFYSCSSLTNVTIPNSVTTISSGAFDYCTAITSFEVSENNENYTSKDGVLFNKNMTELMYYPASSNMTEYTIPNSVTKIGSYVFHKCSKLIEINVNEENENYTSQDGVLFNKAKTELIQYPIGNKQTSYAIPSSVTTIGSSTFYSCTGLTIIEIPNSVTTIGINAFWGCIGLTEINVNEENENYTSQDGVLFNKAKTELVQYPVGNERTSYTIPNGVTKIGNYAFEYCSNLTNVTIPNSVKSIGGYAFYGCDNLTIYGRSRSYAESYAKKYNIPFSAIKKSELSFGDISLNVSTPTYNDDEVTINISVSNNKQNSENFTLYAVGYSAGGAIVGIKQISVTDNNYSGNVEFDVSEKPAYVKVFAFDAVNGASPLCVAQETKLN